MQLKKWWLNDLLSYFFYPGRSYGGSGMPLNLPPPTPPPPTPCYERRLYPFSAKELGTQEFRALDKSLNEESKTKLRNRKRVWIIAVQEGEKDSTPFTCTLI